MKNSDNVTSIAQKKRIIVLGRTSLPLTLLFASAKIKKAFKEKGRPPASDLNVLI